MANLRHVLDVSSGEFYILVSSSHFCIILKLIFFFAYSSLGKEKFLPFVSLITTFNLILAKFTHIQTTHCNVLLDFMFIILNTGLEISRNLILRVTIMQPFITATFI